LELVEDKILDSSRSDEEDLPEQRERILENLSALSSNIAELDQPERFNDAATLIYLEDIQSVLEEKEALVVINEAIEIISEVIKVTLISKDSFETIDIYAYGSLSEDIEAVRDSVSLNYLGRPTNRFAHDPAFWIWDQLFGRFETIKSKGMDTINFVSTGFLDNLPFSLLITEYPADKGFFSDYAWAYKSYSFNRIPSVRAFYTPRISRIPTSKQRNFLGVGDPLFNSEDTLRRSLSVVEENVNLPVDLSSLGALPDTRRELETLSSFFAPPPASRILLGAEATESAIKNTDLSGYSAIVFATHAILPGELPGVEEAALVLSVEDPANDSLLYISEIAQLDINADLVILSACNTYTEDPLNDGGLSSLATGFLAAGTRSLLATHWPVNSEVTTFLTTSIVRNYFESESEGVYSALRKTIDAARSKFGWDHPAYWSPFSVVGDGLAH
jgi:CHAT domain-containing protein